MRTYLEVQPPPLYHEEREMRRLLSGIRLHQHAIAKHEEPHMYCVWGSQNVLRIFWLHKLPATMGPNLASPSNGASDGLSDTECVGLNQLPTIIVT